MTADTAPNKVFTRLPHAQKLTGNTGNHAGDCVVCFTPVLYMAKPGDLVVEARMPLNIAARKVRTMLFKDLCEAGDALIVTGYSGLDQLIQLINQRGEDKGVLRLLLGSEPSPDQAAN